MQKKALLAALATLCATPLTAQVSATQSAESLEPSKEAFATNLTARQLDRMCSTKGAFGYAFGTLDVPTSTKTQRLMRQRLKLPDAYQPFENMQPYATLWSRELAQIEYTTREFDPNVSFSKADGAALGEQIDPLLRALGWERHITPDPGEVPMYLLGTVGDYTWKKTTGTGAQRSIIYLSVDAFAQQIYLTCAHDQLLQKLMREGLGRIPDGTPRPELPELPMARAPTMATCLAPENAAELEAFMSNGRPTNFITIALARGDYHQKLARWIEWRLEAAGMDADALFDLMMDWADPGKMTDSFALLKQLPGLLSTLDKARDSGDQKAACSALVALSGFFDQTERKAMAQTSEFEKRARVHAKKLGISLD